MSKLTAGYTPEYHTGTPPAAPTGGSGQGGKLQVHSVFGPPMNTVVLRLLMPLSDVALVLAQIEEAVGPCDYVQVAAGLDIKIKAEPG